MSKIGKINWRTQQYPECQHETKQKAVDPKMPRDADPSTKPLVHEQQASAKYILKISTAVSAN